MARSPSTSAFPGKYFRKPRPFCRRAISDRARNDQFNLGARIAFAPDFQTPAHDFSPLAHAVQTEVSRRLLEHSFVIDALSVIANRQVEMPLVVSNLHGDPPRLRVPEGVAQRLARDAVGLVAEDRVQIARWT